MMLSEGKRKMEDGADQRSYASLFYTGAVSHVNSG